MRCSHRWSTRPGGVSFAARQDWGVAHFSLKQRTKNGAPERIRTSDPQIRSLVLYPAELRVRFERANLLGRPRKRKSKDGPSSPDSAASVRECVRVARQSSKSRPFRENLATNLWGSGIVVPCPAPLPSLRLKRPKTVAPVRVRGWVGLGVKGPRHIKVRAGGGRRGSGEQ